MQPKILRVGATPPKVMFAVVVLTSLIMIDVICTCPRATIIRSIKSEGVAPTETAARICIFCHQLSIHFANEQYQENYLYFS